MGSVGVMDKVLLYKALAKNGAEKSASGNPVVLTDTIEGKLLKDLKLYGMSKQFTATGKNLLKIRDGVQTTRGVTAIAKDGVVALKGTATETGWALINADSFVLDGMYILSSNITGIIVKAVNKSYEEVLGQNESKTLENAEVSRIAFVVKRGETYDVSNILIQIEKGSEATSYEPYTGGKPSPSPEYPQEIVSVGGNGSIEVNVRGKNLTDIYGYSAASIENPEDKRVLNNEFGTTLNTTEKTDKLIVNQEILDGGVVGSYRSGYFIIGINRKLEYGKDYIITFRINVIRNPFSTSNVDVSFNGIEFEHGKIIGDKVTVKAKKHKIQGKTIR